MKKLFIIYAIRNRINGKQYIGLTVNGLAWRWQKHLQAAKQGGNYPILRALRKYGSYNFTRRVLQVCQSIAQLKCAEISWIAKLKTLSPQGYNLTLGGDGTHGLKHNRAHRVAIENRPSVRRKKIKASLKLWQSPTYRKRCLAARRKVKEKHRQATIAAMQRPSVRRRVLASYKSPTRSKRISKALRAAWRKPAYRKLRKQCEPKRKAAAKRAVQMPAYRRKMSKIAKQVQARPEVKRKHRLGLIRAWQRRLK